MSVRRQLSRQTKALVMMAISAVAGLASAAYLLTNERLSSPFASSYTIKAQFTNVSGISPGIGIPVNVAGVRVGQVTGSALSDGRGVLTMQIDPSLLPHVYTNATATLVPRTPLKDMQVDLGVGGAPAPPLPAGATLPLAQTVTPVDSDELLSALDADTRTWLQVMITDLDTGLGGQGSNLGAFLRALAPTVTQTRQIGDLLASRRVEIRRVVHNLGLLTQSLADGDQDLGEVVHAGNAVLATLSAQDAPLRQSVAQLPGTLSAARSTVGHVTTFANVLHPTLDALTPLAQRLPGLLRNVRTLLSGGGVLPVRPVKEFARATQPLVPLLGPTTRELSAQLPPLTSIEGVLHRVTNATAYVPGAGDQGYLYWLAWFAHNLNSVVSTGDAHGAVIRGLGLFSCSSAAQPGQPSTIIDQVLGFPSSCRSGP